MPVLDRLVAAKVRAEFGGRLRRAIAGGAMPSAVSRLFLAMGIDVLQGYGMTESSPIVSVNSPTRNDPATVGEPIEGVEVRIGGDDELMVRGPNVMMGYWRREAETARALEPDGWLHTGDRASLENGMITRSRGASRTSSSPRGVAYFGNWATARPIFARARARTSSDLSASPSSPAIASSLAARSAAPRSRTASAAMNGRCSPITIT